MKRRTKIIVLVFLAAVLMAALFTYLALLGENNRITNVAAEFFVQIRKQHYGSTYQFLSRELAAGTYPDPEQFYATCFHLEATLLTKYDLLGQRSYKVLARKNHFWTPLFGAKAIGVSIGFKPKERDKTLASYLSEEQYPDLVEDLLTLVREDGHWKLGSINIQDSSVAGLYQQIERQVKLDQYIQSRPGGFVVAPIEIVPRSMSALERRRLNFIIHKITRVLRQQRESEKAAQ